MISKIEVYFLYSHFSHNRVSDLDRQCFAENCYFPFLRVKEY
jgi:hypothetical protein